ARLLLQLPPGILRAPDATIMNHGRWRVVRELKRGGQATAYLVTDDASYKLTDELAVLQKALADLAIPIQFQERTNDAARTALATIERYLQRESRERLHVLKLLHEGARSDQKA